MNFYLEKVNNEKYMWKCCIFITLGLLILHLLYNMYYEKTDDEYNKQK